MDERIVALARTARTLYRESLLASWRGDSDSAVSKMQAFNGLLREIEETIMHAGFAEADQTPDDKQSKHTPGTTATHSEPSR